MSVTVVVGGQFGSEGKGKTTSLLARDYGEECAVVRCGGPNSGHIVHEYGRQFCFRLLPTGVVYGRRGFLAPAAVVDLQVLRDELCEYEVSPDLLTLDPFSVVITEQHRKEEAMLRRAISSTGSGTGAATAAKVMRTPKTRLIKDVLNDNRWLEPYVRDVRSEINELIDQGFRIIVEGTQGFGLSLHHSRGFPKTTSKDTSAGQFVMESGLSPLLVDEIVMVIRTFPIRVSGVQSGKLPYEISWEELRRESGYPHDISEHTTVTRKIRRVANFELSIVLDACQVNRPTKLAVHGLDYLGYENLGVSEYALLTKKAKVFLDMVTKSTGVPIMYAFTGKENSAVVRSPTPERLRVDPKRVAPGKSRFEYQRS
jgi:adenylosuccinate synthase